MHILAYKSHARLHGTQLAFIALENNNFTSPTKITINAQHYSSNNLKTSYLILEFSKTIATSLKHQFTIRKHQFSIAFHQCTRLEPYNSRVNRKLYYNLPSQRHIIDFITPHIKSINLRDNFIENIEKLLDFVENFLSL